MIEISDVIEVGFHGSRFHFWEWDDNFLRSAFEHG